jgi:hypothetical protein
LKAHTAVEVKVSDDLTHQVDLLLNGEMPYYHIYQESSRLAFRGHQVTSN